MDTPPKTLRGLNKPKCIQCGNVARSRCPYQSCKNCCFKAQNPCHIHVLKANPTTTEKTPTSSAPQPEPQPPEVSPATSSLRVASLRQLSNHFSQFNNLHTSRAKKPLTRKEAAALNEWRFSKLNEYRERNIEVENEAFDRYMQNIGLIEEVFCIRSNLESANKETIEDESFPFNADHTSLEYENEKVTPAQKLKLRLNHGRNERAQKRIQQIIDAGFKKLIERELTDTADGLRSIDELDEMSGKAKKLRVERASALNDIVDKLNKARNEEELTWCQEMKAQLYSHQKEADDLEVSNEQPAEKELDYLSQKLFRTVEVDQEDLNKIAVQFSSLGKVASI